MPALIGPIGTVVNMNQAAYGNAMGNPSYASQLAVAQGVNGQAQIIALYNQALTNTTPAALTATVMNNLFITTAAGVSQANVTAISTYLNSVFAQFPTAKGQIISNLTNILGGLEGDAAWGGAATAFNNEAAADYAYSINPANINSGTPSSTPTFSLTTGVDTVPNNSADQLVSGTLIGTAAGTGTTLNIFDVFNVGAGTDTLNLITSAATDMSAGNVPTLNGVEIITLNSLSGASSIVSTVAPDLTTLNLNSYAAASAFTVTVASAAMRTFGITNSVFDVNDLTVTYATGASSSATDTVTLNLNVVNGPTAGAANDALISFRGAAAGVNSGIETFVVNATGTNALESLISLENNGGATALSALTVNGTGSLAVDTALVFDSTNIGTINASGNSGGTNLGVGTINLTYTGGSGNDVLRFTTAGDLDSNDTINMGTGTDTIVLADTSITTTTTALNTAITATGAEIIGFSAAGTSVDMSAVTATQVASYQTANGNLTFTKLLASDTVIITQGVSTAADVIVSGQLGFTTANVTLQGSATAGVSMDDLTAQNLATLQINSAGGSAAVNTLDNLVLSANAVVTITGTQGLTVTNALANAAVVINGSAMTGVLTVTAGTTASSLVGGSGADVLTGGTGADTIVGGAGNDTINSGVDIANANTVIGGLGADTINLQNDTTAAATYGVSATAAESYATTGQFDTVNNASIANTDSNVITLTTGLLSATLTGAASVNIGVTAVAAGSFLAVGSTNGTLTATSQNFQIYQDSNSNGVIDSTDLRVDFNKTGNDTIAVEIVGSKVVVTVAGVTD